MAEFTGFPHETVSFFARLAKNNDKYWFNEHKAEFQDQVLRPAQAFVVAMGERLRKLRPAVQADPRVDKSIFRIYRDTRFSKGKQPFKTHLGIFFWEGSGKKMECPGFYFHLEPNYFMLAAGIYFFPPPLLARYRESVADAKRGPALARTIAKVQKNKGIQIGGEHYKRVPRGFPQDHPRADLLRYQALYAFSETALPKELTSAKVLDYAEQRWAKMVPVHAWLVDLIK
jgi:uncharacterized protein (TIGR02453 family)